MKVLASFKKSPSAYYFFPKYEILDGGGLREIVEPNKEFPNMGTFYMAQTSEDVDMYIGRLIRISVDTENVSLSYDSEKQTSCAYAASPQNIEHLIASDIVEIIEIDKKIEQLINNDTDRLITLEKKPLNSRIMLKIENLLYGYFEYTVTSRDDLSGRGETGVTIKISGQHAQPSNTIKKYHYSDLERSIYDFKPNINQWYEKTRYFIYNSDLLNKIEALETIDFIDNSSLLNLIKKLVSDEESITFTNENLRAIKEVISALDNLPYKESRINRIVNLINLTESMLDLKDRVLDQYFKRPESREFKEKYLTEHKDLLRDVISSVEGYTEIRDQLNKEKETTLNMLKESKNELVKIKNETNEFAQKAIQVKQMDLDKLELQIIEKAEKLDLLMKKLSIYDEYDKMSERFKKLAKECEHQEWNKATLERQKERLGAELDDMSRNIREKLVQLASSKMDNDIIDFMFRTIPAQRALATKVNRFEVLPKGIDTNIEYEEVLGIFLDNMNNRAKRSITKNEAINILIAVTQNFVTVFAGLPGVGKTSLCSILAKSLGLYEKRYIKIPVERGWTSRKDLIGYYNPITKAVEKTNIEFYNALSQVNSEHEKGISNIPYLVLLDEANLSPIEHYWASFMTLNDSYTEEPIIIGEDCRFYLTDGFRFLATINYDHTTEALSQRFLDRAWVIMIDAPELNDNSEVYQKHDVINNYEKVIDYSLLKKYFLPSGEESVSSQFREVFEEIKNILKPYQPVSPRSHNVVMDYCAIAQKYMDLSKESFLPLDYAVAQKILPLISGNGDDYKGMLEKLYNVCDHNSLRRSASILKNIKECGDKQYGYYNYFQNR